METRVKKLWGAERWLHNDHRYCMKILTLEPGFQSSLHYHKVKAETFLCIGGRVKLEIMPGYHLGGMNAPLHNIYLKPYQYHTLEPNVPHRFTAIDGPAVIVEGSTPHSDEDVVRLEESCKIGG